MTNTNDARKAHKILDDLLKGKMVLDEEREFLRSTLPELPKQKTLEEIIAHVRDAWVGANDNDWAGNSYDRDISIEDWMAELYVQMQGLKDTPTSSPALPAGMRLANHKEFGRVVATDWIDSDNEHFCVFRSDKLGYGTYAFLPKESLTFIDSEPAPPEFLETEADYANAPEGTVVACEGSLPWHKFDSAWLSTAAYEGSSDKDMPGTIRRVLRWGWSE